MTHDSVTDKQFEQLKITLIRNQYTFKFRLKQIYKGKSMSYIITRIKLNLNICTNTQNLRNCA